MKKILITLILGMFLLSLVSAISQQLPQCFSGDEELAICFGDEELIFLSKEIPAAGGGPGGAGAGHTTTPIKPPEEIPLIEEAIPFIERVDPNFIWFFVFSMFLVAIFVYGILNGKIKKLYFLWKRDKEKGQK